ncbi:MAG: multi-sensor hybrid histidine kinase, partial [Rariglobus sp.]|nr:multi-sensor hybrid histidine kinase [Rariglobus sp.]
MSDHPLGSTNPQESDLCLHGHGGRLKVPLAYVLAVVFTSATLWARLAVGPWVGERPFLIAFLIPIIVCSYLGGVGPGLVATVLAALGTNYFLVSPVSSLGFLRPLDGIQWLIFILTGTLVSCLSGALLRARQRDSAVISELRKAKELLGTSTKEAGALRTALDEHAIVAITDAQGKITFVNDKFCAISKYSREELIGQDHRIINSGYHPRAF